MRARVCQRGVGNRELPPGPASHIGSNGISDMPRPNLRRSVSDLPGFKRSRGVDLICKTRRPSIHRQPGHHSLCRIFGIAYVKADHEKFRKTRLSLLLEVTRASAKPPSWRLPKKARMWSSPAAALPRERARVRQTGHPRQQCLSRSHPNRDV